MAVSRTSLLASAVSALVVVLVNISQAKAMVAFDNYQYTDGPMGVYWYVLPDQQNIKIMFQFDFGNSSSAVDKWLGIGFREAGYNTMGPGVFYTGQTDTFQVTARAKTSADSGFPPPFDDDTLSASGCELRGSVFYCYVLRAINGAASSDVNVDLAADNTVLMFAHGDLASGDISFHHNNYGLSEALNVVNLSPTLPSIVTSVVNVQWSPTPLENLDVYLTGDFTSEGSASDRWVGFGVGTSGSSMGPGEFYTGQSDTLAITNRYRSSGSGFPPAKPTNESTILTSDSGATQGPHCYVVVSNLTCSFSRPLVTSGTDTISLEDSVYVLWAVGPVSNGEIQFHNARSISTVAYPMYNITVNAAGGGGSSNTMYQIHGIIMIICWLFLLPFGIFVARFRDVLGMGAKPDGSGVPLWWQIHRPAQYLGVILVVVSATIIFVRVNQAWTSTYFDGTYTKGIHQIVGLTSILLTILQPMLAMMRNGVNEKDESRKKRCHNIWHVIHGLCGYSALLLAIICVALGIEEYNYTSEWPGMYVVGYGICVAAMVCFSIFGIVMTLANKTKSVLEPPTTTYGVTDSESGKTETTEDADVALLASKHAASTVGPRTFPWLAWVFLFVLLFGTVFCVTLVCLDPYRELSHGVVI